MDSISHAKFTHNHHPYSITSQSLFFLMMGYKPHALSSVIPNSAISAVKTRLKNLTVTQNEALAAHELAWQVMAARTWQRFVPFKKGEKSGWKHKIWNAQSPIWNLPQKEKAPLLLLRSYLPSHTNSTSQRLERFIWSFTPPSYLPIAKTMYMVQTSPPPYLTLLWEKKNMK